MIRDICKQKVKLSGHRHHNPLELSLFNHNVESIQRKLSDIAGYHVVPNKDLDYARIPCINIDDTWYKKSPKLKNAYLETYVWKDDMNYADSFMWINIGDKRYFVKGTTIPLAYENMYYENEYADYKSLSSMAEYLSE